MWLPLSISLSLGLTIIVGQSAALPSLGGILHRRSRDDPVFDPGVTQPWPKQDDGWHKIPYCYMPSQNTEDDKKVAEWFSEAIKIWEQPKSTRGLSAQFTLFIQYNFMASCPTSGAFLEISIIKGYEIYTTLGYKGEGAKHTMEIGRDLLKVKSTDVEAIQKRIGRLAHEQGRNMGLVNAHQVFHVGVYDSTDLNTPDYEIKCNHVLGYKAIVREHSKADALQACTSMATATRLKWTQAMQLAKYFPEHYNPLFVRFGRDSIMHLAPDTFGYMTGILCDKKQERVLILVDPYASSATTVEVDWFGKGPSLQDLKVLMLFYGEFEQYHILQGESVEEARTNAEQDRREGLAGYSEQLPAYTFERLPSYASQDA